MNGLNTVLLAIAIILMALNLTFSSGGYSDLKETLQDMKSHFDGRLNEKEWLRECP